MNPFHSRPVTVSSITVRRCDACRREFPQISTHGFPLHIQKLGPITHDQCRACLASLLADEAQALDDLRTIRRNNYDLAFKYSTAAG